MPQYRFNHHFRLLERCETEQPCDCMLFEGTNGVILYLDGQLWIVDCEENQSIQRKPSLLGHFTK